jgi:hypothetical protein
MGEPRQNRRFTVEEIDNGWLIKISEAGSDKLVGRHAFLSLASLFSFLREELESDS